MDAADATHLQTSKRALASQFLPHMESFFCRQADCPLATEGGFSSEKDRDQHDEKHESRVFFEWEDCWRVFSRVGNMRDHMRRTHHQSTSTRTLIQAGISTDVLEYAPKSERTIIAEICAEIQEERLRPSDTSQTVHPRNSPSEVLKPDLNRPGIPRKRPKRSPEPRGHVKEPSASMGQSKVSQYPNTGYQVSCPPETQRWCGNCNNGPKSHIFNSRCLFCYSIKDTSA